MLWKSLVDIPWEDENFQGDFFRLVKWDYFWKMLLKSTLLIKKKVIYFPNSMTYFEQINDDLFAKWWFIFPDISTIL